MEPRGAGGADRPVEPRGAQGANTIISLNEIEIWSLTILPFKPSETVKKSDNTHQYLDSTITYFTIWPYATHSQITK